MHKRRGDEVGDEHQPRRRRRPNTSSSLSHVSTRRSSLSFHHSTWRKNQRTSTRDLPAVGNSAATLASEERKARHTDHLLATRFSCRRIRRADSHTDSHHGGDHLKMDAERCFMDFATSQIARTAGNGARTPVGRHARTAFESSLRTSDREARPARCFSATRLCASLEVGRTAGDGRLSCGNWVELS